MTLATEKYGLEHSEPLETPNTSNSPTVSSSVARLNATQISHYNNHHQLVVVDSVSSGTGRQKEKDVYNKILAPLFAELGIKHRYLKTESAATITEFAQELRGGSYAVILISGDTSVTELINALPENETGAVNICVVPCGTGNSIALSLGTTTVFAALQRFFRSVGGIQPVQLHTYEALFPDGSYYVNSKIPIKDKVRFVVVLSWAFHAALVADSDTPELRKHGVDRFRMAAESNLEKNCSYEGSYLIDTKSYNGPFAYWLVTATSRFEEKFLILPKGDINRPELHVVLFGAQSDATGGYIMEVMQQVYQDGSHVDNKKVVYQRIGTESGVWLTTEGRNERFCVDGAIVVVPEPGTIGIRLAGDTVRGWTLGIV